MLSRLRRQAKRCILKDVYKYYFILTSLIWLFSSGCESVSGAPISRSDEEALTEARLELVEQYIAGAGIEDERVLQAMRTVPRHRFVPTEFIDQAYEDHALPIGYGQSISQPYVVAWMTELLELKPGTKVLEIGTGSGYQAAILAEIGGLEVYTMEIVPELATHAASLLQELGYNKIHVKEGDGYYGWQEYAPFDAIIITAAPDHVPSPLVEQLSEGGRLVVPIGPAGFVQTMWKFVLEAGELKAYSLGSVVFVPLTGAGMESEVPGPNPLP